MEEAKKEKPATIYKYIPLSNVVAKPSYNLNFYGVVIDSTYPYPIRSGNYLCLVKLIDASIASSMFLHVSLFGLREESLPKVAVIGCILRVHRGHSHTYKNQMQCTVDIAKGNAWVLFDLSNGETPIAQSGMTYSYTNDDSKALAKIRKFAREHLHQNEIINKGPLTIAERLSFKIFDAICLVLNIKKKLTSDNQKVLSLKLCDEERIIKMEVPEAQFSYINKLDVIKIRNVASNSTFTQLLMTNNTNLQIIPSGFKTSENLINKLMYTVNKDIKLLFQIYWSRACALDSMCSILNDHSIEQPTKLKDITELRDRKFHRIRVKVITISPSSPTEWIWAKNKETNECIPQSEVKEGEYNYYWKIQFIVQETLFDDPNLYRIYLCSLQGQGDEFFNPQLCTLIKSKEDERYLKRVSKLLVQPWIILDLIVEVVTVAEDSCVLLITDTKLNIC